MVIKAKKFLESQGTSMFVFVAVMLMLIFSGFSVVRGMSYTRCVANYNNSTNAYLRQRAMLVDAEDVAVSHVILAVANANTPMEIEYALGNYVIAQAAIDEQRAQHPIPAPPSEVCH